MWIVCTAFQWACYWVRYTLEGKVFEQAGCACIWTACGHIPLLYSDKNILESPCKDYVHSWLHFQPSFFFFECQDKQIFVNYKTLCPFKSHLIKAEDKWNKEKQPWKARCNNQVEVLLGACTCRTVYSKYMFGMIKALYYFWQVTIV